MQDEDNEDEEDDGSFFRGGDVAEYMTKLGHSNSWKLLVELEITAEMLQDESEIPDRVLFPLFTCAFIC